MNCLIDASLKTSLERGKPLEVIKRYIWLRYRINVDLESLSRRLKSLSPKLHF
jgi:hypothetical protein